MSSIEIRPNRGFGDKFKHLLTGKDYYTTSTGVKIKCDKDYGSVFEDENGKVIADRLQNAVIKGTDEDDSITVNNSTVEKLSAKDGDDDIQLINSTAQNVYGGRGDDYIMAVYSQVSNIEGGSNDDEISVLNSEVGSIFSDVSSRFEDSHFGFVKNGSDEIHAYKSNISTIDTGRRSDTITAESSSIDTLKGGNLFNRNVLLNTESEINNLSHTKVIQLKPVFSNLDSFMPDRANIPEGFEEDLTRYLLLN